LRSTTSTACRPGQPRRTDTPDASSISVTQGPETHESPALPLYPYSPECVEGEFSEVRLYGVLRSCAGSCNPSYLTTLHNSAGPTDPVISRRGQPMAREEGFFDNLARGLADGSLTRGKALRLMGAALVGGALASFPGAAWGARGGNSACAKYCSTLFTEGSAAHEACVSQGTRGTGPCFACGGPGNPAPTCGINQTLNTTTCQCEGPVCPAGSVIGAPCGTCQTGSSTSRCICFPSPGGGRTCVSPAFSGSFEDCSNCVEGEQCYAFGVGNPACPFGEACFYCARPCPPNRGPCSPT
jgi:hypothetical protein